MVITRIRIEGFLCYGEAQVIDLSDLSLCMLSGPNGSGKSSVFDAVTFALFGEHRGGKQLNDDLINKKRDRASVEVEFELKGKRYQVRRTLARKKGSISSTQVLRAWNPTKNDWEVVPETQLAKGLQAWVKNNIGLTAETFTCSMLLRQGKADRLITSSPKERAELLGTVVGLDQYQRLFELASDCRKETDGRCKILQVQLQAMPEVSEEKVSTATATVEAAQQVAAKADEAVERLPPLLEHARNWAQWQFQLGKIDAQLAQHGKLLATAEEIERKWNRLQELRQALPHLQTIVEKRNRLAASEKAVQETNHKQLQVEAERAGLTVELETLSKRLERVESDVAAAQDKERSLTGRSSHLRSILAVADRVEQQRTDLDKFRADLAKLPADPAEDWENAKAQLRHLDEQATMLPILRRLDTARSEIGGVRDRQVEADGEAKAALELARQAAAEITELQQQLDKATAGQRTAQSADAQAAAEAKLARAAAAELRKAEGKAQCPTCGHELTHEHLAHEESRRREREEAAGRTRAEAAKHLQAAEREAERLSSSLVDAQKRRANHEVTGKDRQTAARVAGDDLVRLMKTCGESYAELLPPYQQRVGKLPHNRALQAEDWTATRWPMPEDLANMTRELHGRPEAQKRASAAEGVNIKYRDLSTKIETIEQAMGQAAVPADVQALRAEHAQLEGELSQLRQANDEWVKLRKKLAPEVERKRARASELAAEVERLAGDVRQEQVRQEGYRHAISTAVDLVPPQWTEHATAIRSDSLRHDENELEQLESTDIETAYAGLQQARIEAAALADRMAQLKSEIGRLPEAARRQPPEIERELRDARVARADSQGTLKNAEATLHDLERQRKQRVELDGQYKTADRSHQNYRKLAELLGREELQLHLMRRAEREIVQFANDVLNKISNGDLVLRLRDSVDEGSAVGAGGDHVLDLEAVCRQTASNDAFAVAFLSGSQQFRVAVALALAIGQYAGGGSKLGECAIIDEGFGSLDTLGQDVMIKELRELHAKSNMKRIILVSHQEAFASAFPHGYGFVLHDGQTRVSRLNV